jgi:hypothetical protein
MKNELYLKGKKKRRRKNDRFFCFFDQTQFGKTRLFGHIHSIHSNNTVQNLINHMLVVFNYNSDLFNPIC